MDNSNRIVWLDYAKGIAIILVVLGHTFRDEMLPNSIICYYIKEIIYSFHMGLFMMLSGILFGVKRRQYVGAPKAYVMKKIKTLAQPFILASAVLYLIFNGITLLPVVRDKISIFQKEALPVGAYILDCLRGVNPYGVHLWFIYSLFIISLVAILLFIVLEKAKLSDKAVFIVICVFVCIVWFLRYLLDPTVVIVYRTMSTGMYFFIGIIWGSVRVDRSRMPYKLLSALAWLLILIKVYLGSIGMESAVFKLFMQFVVLLCIDNVILFAKKMSDAAWSIFSCLGEKSFTVYLLHQPFFCAVTGYVLLKINTPYVLIVVLCLISGVVIPLLIDRIIHSNSIFRKIGSAFGL